MTTQLTGRLIKRLKRTFSALEKNGKTAPGVMRGTAEIAVRGRLHTGRARLIACCAVTLAGTIPSLLADVTVTATEAGGTTTFNYSGSIDLTGLPPFGPSIGTISGITPNVGGSSFFGNQNGGFTFYNVGLDIPPTLGPGGVGALGGPGGAGDPFGWNSFGNLWLPTGYMTNGPLAGSTITIANTLLGMGVDPAGRTFIIGNNTIYFLTLAPVDPVDPVAAAPGLPAPGGAILLTDLGAIFSAETTGIQTGLINRQVTQNAGQRARVTFDEVRIADMEIFTDGFESGDVSSWSTGTQGSHDPTSVTRYLNFAANQNIDYRVALGLAEGEEVMVADTLAAHDTLWASSPFAMVGGPVALASAKAVVAVPEGAGKSVVDDKQVVELNPRSRFAVYTAFDYGFYDQDNLTRAMRGFETDSYAGSVGLHHRLLDWLVVGGAFTHLQSDTEATSNLGGVDLEGQLLSAYATAFFSGTYLDVLYSYGDFNNEINRNTLMGSTARGDTDSHSHNVSVNVGHNIRITDQISVGPYAGLDYTTGGIDGYTETRGGAANLVYPDDNFESMVSRLGGQVTHRSNTPLGKLTTSARAAWAREYKPEADSLSASLQTSPFVLVSGGSARRIGGYTAEGEGAHPGTDWLELGAGVRLDLGDTGFNVGLGYEAQFARNNASAHFGSLKVGYEW